MKTHGTRVLLFFALAAGWPGLAKAQASNPHPQGVSQRVVTTTRLVTVFSELETEWLQDVQQKDSAALERLLSEDFQELSPNLAGPVPSEDWQQLALTQDLRSFRLRQMAVRSLNEVTAVASFVLNKGVQSGSTLQERNSFVVDVWTKVNGRWVCAGRYAAPVSRAEQPVVGDAKPNGKH